MLQVLASYCLVMEGTGIRAKDGRVPRYWLLIVAAVAVSFAMLVTGERGQAATAYDDEELRFLRLINDYRDENGLRPVILSDTLTASSERHSKDMAKYSFFAHNTEQSSYYPDGAQPWDRMEAEGYYYNTAKGENLAVGYDTADEAMKAWQESPSHNAAMLDGGYRVMGVARVNVPGSVHGWYWTTDFGGEVDPSSHAAGKSPNPPTPEQPIENPADETTDQPPQPPETREEAGGPADSGDLENGAMGALGAWKQEARDGADLVVDDGYARLGAYHDGRDELRQKIRIKKNTRLVYDLKVRTGANTRADKLLVRVTNAEGKQLAVLDRYAGKDAGWDLERANLSRFAGRTVYLSFYVKTDGKRLTTFYVDDVSLKR